MQETVEKTKFLYFNRDMFRLFLNGHFQAKHLYCRT